MPGGCIAHLQSITYMNTACRIITPIWMEMCCSRLVFSINLKSFSTEGQNVGYFQTFNSRVHMSCMRSLTAKLIIFINEKLIMISSHLFTHPVNCDRHSKRCAGTSSLSSCLSCICSYRESSVSWTPWHSCTRLVPRARLVR